MSKTWGSIGAWAAESERAEAEEIEAVAAAASGTTAPAESQGFPSLKEAVSTKPKKKKMTLSEFTMGTYAPSGAPDYSSNRLTPDEMFRLPTAPRERSAEEIQHGRLGGGFSSYGRSARTMGMGDRSDSWGGGNRRPYGGFDDEQPQRRGPPPRVPDLEQPSRADEVDNWAMTKKPFQPLHSQDSGRQNRYGGLGSGGGFSRADEADNWTAGKKPVMPTRSFTFGSGFSRELGSEPDRWTRGGDGYPHERSILNLNPPKLVANDSIVVKTNKPDPFGAARPREEVLAEKGLDWKKLDVEIETKKATSRPTSSHSSRPSSAQSSRSESQGLQGSESVVKPSRPKINPFGDAKPREVLLAERGQDWRKINLQLERRMVDRPETEEERMLREEVDHLKKELEMNRESQQESGGEQPSMHDIILSKERELEMLIRDLDSKVHFRPKAERPGSGSGTAAGSPERPPSQFGSFDESRSMESMDRPHSQGTGDAWARPGDDRRAFQGGRERGFLGNRDLDRQSWRERW